MSKILYEEQTPYFFIGKCFDLTRPIELAYLSQFHKIDDMKKFQEKLVEAEEYFWLRQSAEYVSEHFLSCFEDNGDLDAEELAEKEKLNEYTNLFLTDDRCPYGVMEVYKAITSLDRDISMINASVDYFQTYIGFLISVKKNAEEFKKGSSFYATSLNPGWGKMIDPIIDKFINIFGLNPNLDILELDENYIVQGKDHPLTLPPHIQY